MQIDRQVRAFNPWPVAFTSLGDEVLRLWQCELLSDISGDVSDRAPGRVLATGREGIDVATGDGLLRITRLQPPGKRVMSAAEFLNARDLHDALLG